MKNDLQFAEASFSSLGVALPEFLGTLGQNLSTWYRLLAMNERKRTLSKKHDKREDWFKEPVNVTMTRDTKHSCEVFRNKSIQPVEDGECVIHYPNKDSFYPIRFAHDSIIERARKLRAGDNLVLLKARFRRPFGRSETQLYVKSFEVTKGD
jgi:hypothetical protein